LVGDSAVGIVGALLSTWLLPRFGVHFLGGTARLVIDCAIGAGVLLLVLRLTGAADGDLLLAPFHDLEHCQML
jgi:uncharacterized membrane protein YeaQ/YmgE (transglycosylase-associated protein family)